MTGTRRHVRDTVETQAGICGQAAAFSASRLAVLSSGLAAKIASIPPISYLHGHETVKADREGLGCGMRRRRRQTATRPMRAEHLGVRPM